MIGNNWRRRLQTPAIAAHRFGYLVDFVRRARRKPAGLLARRLLSEAHVEAGRVAVWLRHRRFGLTELLTATEASSLDELWTRLSARRYPAATTMDAAFYDSCCPGDADRIRSRAEAAIARRVTLLGGSTVLGSTIDWHSDFKTGTRWPRGFALRMQYNQPDRPSDVKVAWELSRLHWVIPLGQAYALDGDERWAEAARDILQQWIVANPYGYTVNWAVTMEVALRIICWTWLFHVFAESRAWRDPEFRADFLRTIFLHGEFTDRYIEKSDINGNHFTADAAGLVFAGLFFGTGAAAERWQRIGWQTLVEEMPRQVFPDGVDFEMSVAYHRLVTELFLLPTLYRETQSLPTPPAFRERLLAMIDFVESYSRPDGTTPLWGDADDARALPFGSQAITDHRYLIGVGAVFANDTARGRRFTGPVSEVAWLCGAASTQWLLKQRVTQHGTDELPSRAFGDGGFFVMRTGVDHVFIDCGDVGLRGRGGHGHNDCLSFEAALDGQLLISDCGSYLYTASYEERNRFRSTASHNTPRVAEEELNRFTPRLIWVMQNDARPHVHRFETSPTVDLFEGSHDGYRRLTPPVLPVRRIALDRLHHRLLITDRFESEAPFAVEIPLHLAIGVHANASDAESVELTVNDRRFMLNWRGVGKWRLAVEAARVSPSYGVAVATQRLVWRADQADGHSVLAVVVRTIRDDKDAALRWATNVASMPQTSTPS